MKKLLCMLLALVILLSFWGCEEEKTTKTKPKKEEILEEEPLSWMTLPADRTLTASQYFVYDCETGKFLTCSGAENEKIYPASITKLFTAYVATQFLRLDQKITVGDALNYVAAGSSVAELERGDSITTERLVEAMMLPSGNDAAYVLAVEAGHGLSEKAVTTDEAIYLFVKEMNRQAKALGMSNTNFANPDGIHQADHYSSFHDLAILGTVVQEDPVLMSCVGIANDQISLESGTKTWKNTNALIHEDSQYYCPYAIGLKTGQTPSAGSCLLSAFDYHGQKLVIGVFGCPEADDRFADTLQLFNDIIGYTG